MADDIEQIKARLRDYEHIKYGSGLVLVKHANVLAILDAIAAAEKARNDAATREGSYSDEDYVRLHKAHCLTEERRAKAAAERDALAALLRRADTTMEVAEWLIDCFSNTRASFSGSGTPANCRKDITTLRAEIEAALAPRPSPTA